jgi:hypothetical protein
VHRDPHLPVPTELSFEDAERFLSALVADDLAQGRGLAPTLLAFAGERPLGSVRLRPHGRDGLLAVVLEILALLLPLGTDRIVLALPGRAWSLADPIPPVTEEDDLRQRVVVVVAADAQGGPCRLRTRLHPFTVDGRGRCTWLPQFEPDGPVDAPVLTALQVLLDRRAAVATTAEPPARIAARFGRVLLLGHELSLAPRTAQALLSASAAAGRSSTDASRTLT